MIDAPQAGGPVPEMRLGHDRGAAGARDFGGPIDAGIVDDDDLFDQIRRNGGQNVRQGALFVVGRDHDGDAHRNIIDRRPAAPDRGVRSLTGRESGC